MQFPINEAEIVHHGKGSHRLQCQTYMVRSAGESFFAEEVRLSSLGRLALGPDINSKRQRSISHRHHPIQIA
jgi:hypothetical protein